MFFNQTIRLKMSLLWTTQNRVINSIIAKYCFIIMIAKILYNKRHRIRHISTNYRATTYLLFSPRKYLLKVYLAIKKLRQLKLPCKDNNITFTS